jgi:dihydrofolate synthase/folylpolyglutamate synthase
MKIKNFKDAEEFLYNKIPIGTRREYASGFGLKRTERLLEILGNPQEKIKVVHIAGTSGKGSTTYLISNILCGLGFKTGSYFSPHLLDIRERFQINNKLISRAKFVNYLNEIMPAIKKISHQPSHVRRVMRNYRWKPTYFEILTVLAFYIFWKEGVDYAVIETGCGGRFDATNTVKRIEKLVVLTKIGKDHTRILGETLAKIAKEKAGIIGKGNTVIALKQKPQVNKVIERRADRSNSVLHWVKFKQTDYYVGVSLLKNYFNFVFDGENMKKLELGLLGRYQAENASLAIAAVRILSRKDKFEFSKEKIRKALKTAKFPGRFEAFYIKGKTVIIDGAHNSQKIGALLKSLKEIFPGEKFCFLVSFKKGKDIKGMLTKITQIADKIIVTSFKSRYKDRVPSSEKPERVVRILKDIGFYRYNILKNPNIALEQALLQEKKNITITGSLYLISQIYNTLYLV